MAGGRNRQIFPQVLFPQEKEAGLAQLLSEAPEVDAAGQDAGFDMLALPMPGLKGLSALAKALMRRAGGGTGLGQTPGFAAAKAKGTTMNQLFNNMLRDPKGRQLIGSKRSIPLQGTPAEEQIAKLHNRANLKRIDIDEELGKQGMQRATSEMDTVLDDTAELGLRQELGELLRKIATLRSNNPGINIRGDQISPF